MRRILIGFLVATTLLVPACKKKIEGGNVVQLGADDPGLVAAAAEAKRRWPEFVAAFNEHRPGRKCAVKYAAPIKGGGDEHIWIMVTALGSAHDFRHTRERSRRGHRAEARRCRDDPDGRRRGLAVHRRTVHDRRILDRDSPERRGQARAVHRRTVHDRRSLGLDSPERRGQARRQMNAGGRIADHRAALERRERSSEELACAAPERASALNPALNAFLQLLPDQVLAAARAQDARLARGESRARESVSFGTPAEAAITNSRHAPGRMLVSENKTHVSHPDNHLGLNPTLLPVVTFQM